MVCSLFSSRGKILRVGLCFYNGKEARMTTFYDDNTLKITLSLLKNVKKIYVPEKHYIIKFLNIEVVEIKREDYNFDKNFLQFLEKQQLGVLRRDLNEFFYALSAYYIIKNLYDSPKPKYFFIDKLYIPYNIDVLDYIDKCYINNASDNLYSLKPPMDSLVFVQPLNQEKEIKLRQKFVKFLIENKTIHTDLNNTLKKLDTTILYEDNIKVFIEKYKLIIDKIKHIREIFSKLFKWETQKVDLGNKNLTMKEYLKTIFENLEPEDKFSNFENCLDMESDNRCYKYIKIKIFESKKDKYSIREDLFKDLFIAFKTTELQDLNFLGENIRDLPFSFFKEGTLPLLDNLKILYDKYYEELVKESEKYDSVIEKKTDYFLKKKKNMEKGESEYFKDKCKIDYKEITVIKENRKTILFTNEKIQEINLKISIIITQGEEILESYLKEHIILVEKDNKSHCRYINHNQNKIIEFHFLDEFVTCEDLHFQNIEGKKNQKFEINIRNLRILCEKLIELRDIAFIAEFSINKSKILNCEKELRIPKIGDSMIISGPPTVYVCEKLPFHIITGSNMSGKTFFLMNIFSLVVIVQSGVLLPFEIFEIKIFSKIFFLKEIGLSGNLNTENDNLYSRFCSYNTNNSSLEEELKEIKKTIFFHTKDSLILIDEVGKSGSYVEGLSLGIYISRLFRKTNCFTFFATNYLKLSKILIEKEEEKNSNVFYNMLKTENYNIKSGISKIRSIVFEYLPQDYVPNFIIDDYSKNNTIINQDYIYFALDIEEENKKM